MPDESLLKRLKIIVKECGGQATFAEAAGVNQPAVSKMLSGKSEITLAFIKAAVKLGYATNWILLGTGQKKKGEDDGKKLITHIEELRTEITALATENMSLKARMTSYESDLRELRSLAQNLNRFLPQLSELLKQGQ